MKKNLTKFFALNVFNRNLKKKVDTKRRKNKKIIKKMSDEKIFFLF